MTSLAQIFAELSISQYLDSFIEQGFDSWETILDITESDFDALGVKLGHRRKIQRKIADSRGISTERALASPTQHSLDDRHISEEQKSSRIKGDGKEQLGLSNNGKRKYRRHPKPDENAPDRPPSAYVIFSNKIREDLKHQQLSFTEIAKRVGEYWQNLPPSEKEPYESQAFADKDKYNNALAEYKKTENYSNYQAYLAEFKAKQSSNQQAIAEAESVKRPKLENRISNESSGNGSSSATSQAGGDTPKTRKRGYSGASMTSMPWHGPQNPTSAQSNSSSTVPTPKPFGGTTGMVPHTSPTPQAQVILPGFRDSLAAALPYRESRRDSESGLFQQSALQQQQHSTVPNIQVSRNRPNEQHGGAFPTLSGPAPLLAHDSTVESASSGSSSAGPAYTPRTPMDIEQRTPQFPSLFQSKVPGFFDSNQLPPLRPPSLSPQSSMNNPYQSPQGIATAMDYPAQTQAQHSLRNYHPMPNQNQNQQSMHMSNVNDGNVNMRQHGPSAAYDDDGDLDPVSALIRAGEIVDRNAMNRQP